MAKILYEVETEARVTRWYQVVATSEAEARAAVERGEFDVVSEEVIDEEVTGVVEEFDQDALDAAVDDDELEPF